MAVADAEGARRQGSPQSPALTEGAAPGAYRSVLAADGRHPRRSGLGGAGRAHRGRRRFRRQAGRPPGAAGRLACQAARPARAAGAHPQRGVPLQRAGDGCVELRLGASRGGALQALEARVVVDQGAGQGFSAKRAGAFLTRPYRLPTYCVDCTGAMTNTPPANAYRGQPAAITCFAVESSMDELALRLGRPRLRRLGRVRRQCRGRLPP